VLKESDLRSKYVGNSKEKISKLLKQRQNKTREEVLNKI
jgi:hypothetical protein